MDRIQGTSQCKSTYICSTLLNQMLFSAVQQSQSSQFYRREIQKCEEYLRNIEEEITYNWQPPKKPNQLQNFQDVEFFKSDLCLKNKLNIIQEIKSIKQQKRSSFMSRNTFNRTSMRSRHSSMSISVMRPFRQSGIKNQEDSASKFCQIEKKQSLQKLANLKRLSLVSDNEKEFRQLKKNCKVLKECENRKKHRKIMLLKKQKAELEEQDKLPLLVEMEYKIREQPEKLSKPFKKAQTPKKKQNFNLVSISNSKVSLKASKLKIQEYKPNMNQMTVSNWRKFGDLIGEKKPSKTLQQYEQFKNIHYFIQ